ncbi:MULTISPECIES: Ku protein [Halomonadaceae]|uniref:non-homologous end joining protein Ku n=1 Tax=Halomonadaceae TaxID=28256 RepID=UPI00159867EE|nr:MULTISPECIES: Ku protein [Halomonas]QJQ94893.1 Ku protein [Halomonas sp. PA5]
MPRSLWSGTISFGLVNIPIRLFTAVRDRSIHFHMLTPDGSCRLRRKLYCPETEKEYDFSEAAKGFEVAPGEYIILDKEQVEELKPEKGEDLVIEQFVDVSEIDPIFFDKTYYLGPDKGGKRAYQLLLATLEESKKVALGQFVMRNKQHFVVLRPSQGSLLIHTLNYADEIVPQQEIPGLEESRSRVAKEEMKMARQLLDAMTGPFEPERFTDEFTESVEELIEKARKGKTIKTGKGGSGKRRTNVVNLTDALRGSLEAEKKGATKKSTPKKSAASSKSSSSKSSSSKSSGNAAPGSSGAKQDSAKKKEGSTPRKRTASK